LEETKRKKKDWPPIQTLVQKQLLKERKTWMFEQLSTIHWYKNNNNKKTSYQYLAIYRRRKPRFPKIQIVLIKMAEKICI
jgi:hypothetical protein